MTLTTKVDTESVERVLQNAPAVAYYHIRRFVLGSFIEHRLAWLRAKGTKFGRGGRGIKVHRVGETAGEGPKSVVYDIPKEERARSAFDAIQKLSGFDAELRTGNVVLPVHQFGTDVRARRRSYLALPMRGTRGSLKAWKRKNKDKKLVFRPTRGGDLIAFEVTVHRSRGRGPSRVGGAPRVKWKPRFYLTKEVEMDPTLKLYETWDRLKSDRDRKFGERAARMIDDIARGDRRLP